MKHRELKTVLAIAFFVSIFSSLLWVMYSFSRISESLSGGTFDSVNIADFTIYAGVIFIPVLIIWVIFSFVIQYINSKTTSKNMLLLFKQMKKNQDYTDLIARIMLEAEQEIKDGFVLNRFDLFVADMNELIAEIIYRSNIASGEQVERLWKKVQQGGKWAFGKVIVEVNSNQPNFQMRVFEKSQNDTVLAGTILEFSARYINLLSLLEKHDKSRVFLTMIETGIFGKVFSILSPVSEEVKKNRETKPSRKTAFAPRVQEQPQPLFEPQLEIDGDKKSFVSKINPFKKKKETEEEDFFDEPTQEKDPLSIALERSFGNVEAEVEAPHFGASPVAVTVKDEPVFRSSEPSFGDSNELIIEARDDKTEATGFTNTQKTLNSLKKEWESMKQVDDKPQEPTLRATRSLNEESDENLTYPFAGWADEDNYTK